MKYKFLRTVLIICVFVFAIYDYAKASDFGPFRGKILDADTKEPIEGVVVFVEWRQIHFFAGSTFYDAQETLTDKNGEFHIPGIWVLNPWRHFGVDAILIVYKSGYRAISTGAFRRWKEINPELDYVLKVEDWKPVIVLKRAINVDERWKNVGYADPGSDIPDEKMKLLMKEINKEKENLRKIKP